MEFNIKLEEQDLINGVPSVVQELLMSLNEKKSPDSEKLNEIELSLQQIQECKTRLEEENLKLKEELSKAKRELQENIQIKNDFEFEVKELNDKLADYDFTSLVNGLSDKVKGELENYFQKLDDPKALLFSLLQKNKIEDFYKEVFRRVNNKLLENIEELKLLVRILFGFYCAGTGCQLFEPKVGQEFDGEECIEKETTLGRGKISKVLLFGVRNSDGTVRYEAMVSIEKG